MRTFISLMEMHIIFFLNISINPQVSSILFTKTVLTYIHLQLQLKIPFSFVNIFKIMSINLIIN